MFKLVIQDDEGKTTVVPLVRDEITIGRKEGNTIRLTERNVSRRHARILRSGDAIELEDLSSYNGVRVNGTRIVQKVTLAASDRVQIGDYLIELKSEGLIIGSGNDGAPTQQMEALGAVATDPIVGASGDVANNALASPSVAAAGAAAASTPPSPTAVTAPLATIPGVEPIAADSAQFVRDELDHAETTPVTAKPTAAFARLVVLSTQYAGEEHPLTRPQMVVGRGPESHIQIDHPSLSRNHARVVRELDTGAYIIEDLDSANGVRVNGAEEQRLRLRRGDIVELGELRLRFVEADEAFAFTPELTVADDDGLGGGRKTLWIALAAIAVAAVVGWKIVSRDKPAIVHQPPSGGGPDAPPVVADALPTNAPPADSAGQVDLPVGADPTGAAAPSPVTEFWAAARGDRYAEAFAIYKRHVRDASFAAATADSYTDLERRYSSDVVARTKALLAAGQCAELERLATEAEMILSSAGAAARALGESCQPVEGSSDATKVAKPETTEKPPSKPTSPMKPTGVVGTPASGTASGSGAGGTSKGTGTSSTSASGTTTATSGPTSSATTSAAKDGEPKTAADALAVARDAAFNGFHAKAARYASMALSYESGNVDALQILVISNCKMGKADAAKRYAARLPASSQSAVRQVCLSQGISLD